MSDVPHEQYDSDYLELTSDARNWATLCHLSALLGTFTFVGFFFGPLIVWLLKRNDHPFIDDQGKEAVNFQLSIFIYGILLACTLIGIPIAILLYVVNIVLSIVAAIKASNGEAYRYPLSLRLIN